MSDTEYYRFVLVDMDDDSMQYGWVPEDAILVEANSLSELMYQIEALG